MEIYFAAADARRSRHDLLAFNADVILLGTHGRTGVARLVLGSVARNVLHHASSSVLVVRETPREAPKTDA